MAIPRNLANIAPHVNASSTELVVNDGGANLDFRVEGDTNANLLIADAGAEKVGFGTNTFNTNGGVIQVSNGISFPATQSASSDANTLDDYEEGTWTPSLGGNTTYSSQAGKYVKVGGIVYVSGMVAVSSIGTGSTQFVSGLPFAQTGAGDVSVGSVGFVTAAATNFYSIGCSMGWGSTTEVGFNLQTALDGTTTVGNATVFQDGTRIDFAITYRTTA